MVASRMTSCTLVLLVLAQLLTSSLAAPFLPWAHSKLAQSKNHKWMRYALGVVGTKGMPTFKTTATLLAPTDAAFQVLINKLGITAAQLRANKPLLTKFVLYHTIPEVGVRDLLKMFEVDGTTKYDQNWWIPTALDMDTLPTTTLDGTQAPNSLRMFTRSKGRASFRGYASATQNVKFLFDDVNILTIDTVLIPKIGPFANCKTVGQVLSSYQNFTSVVQALKTAGYWKAVSSQAFYGTVFAPTNDALAAAAKGFKTTVAKLVKNVATVNPLMEYHLVPKTTYLSNMANNGKLLSALVKKPLYSDTKSKPGKVVIKGDGSKATITVPDLFACKAVIHAIDTVLLPK